RGRPGKEVVAGRADGEPLAGSGPDGDTRRPRILGADHEVGRGSGKEGRGIECATGLGNVPEAHRSGGADRGQGRRLQESRRVQVGGWKGPRSGPFSMPSAKVPSIARVGKSGMIPLLRA